LPLRWKVIRIEVSSFDTPTRMGTAMLPTSPKHYARSELITGLVVDCRDVILLV
jgi:hypothetical protein